MTSTATRPSDTVRPDGVTTVLGAYDRTTTSRPLPSRPTPAATPTPAARRPVPEPRVDQVRYWVAAAITGPTLSAIAPHTITRSGS